MERPLALVVEAGAEARESAVEALAAAGIEAVAAASGAEALEALRARPVRIALVSADAIGAEPERFVASATALRPSLVVVAIAGADGALPSGLLRAGAFEVEPRFPDPSRLRLVAGRALAQHDRLEARHPARGWARMRPGGPCLVGTGAEIESVRERLAALAGSNAGVLFSGEAGTGRRLAARALHAMSPRRTRPLVEVDCAALSEAALEAEIFGGQGGGRPGGDRRLPVAFERAAGGSLLFHEVADLPLPVQERLAGALVEAGPPDCRLLATSSADLERRVDESRFLLDLRLELAGAVVKMPSLRDRASDVAALARHFVEEIRAINDLPPVAISPEAADFMTRHSWPGNVRELRSAIERAVILAEDGVIRPTDLPEAVRLGGPAGTPVGPAPRFRDAKRRVIESFEREYLAGLLARHGGNVTAAATQAGMLRSALQRLLRKHEIRSSEFRRGRSGKGPDA